VVELSADGIGAMTKRLEIGETAVHKAARWIVSKYCRRLFLLESQTMKS